MKKKESKSDAFIRLAVRRTNKLLKDISLLGNLSDKRNYKYNDVQVKKIFKTIDAELKVAKIRFRIALKSRRKINL
jgi:hypothetical protein